jgi:hypothetical protein
VQRRHTDPEISKWLGPILNLTLPGGNGGERRYHLSYSLAAAVWTRHAALFEFRDVESLGELPVAILTEKNVLGHGRSPAT